MERSSAGAWKIQQRAVGRHKQRRSDSSALATCLQKESKHGRTAGALFSDPPGNGGDGLPGALRLTACYGLLRATKKLASSKLRASASNSRIFWLTRKLRATILRGLLLRRREDRERSVCIRVGAIPHRAVEAARTGELLRELLAQTSTTTLCRARA